VQQTIDAFLEKLTKDGRSPNTRSAYRVDLNELHRFLQGLSPPVVGWQDVTDVHWAGYLAHLQRIGRSPATIARKSVVLGRFFDFIGIHLSKPAMSAAGNAATSTATSAVHSPENPHPPAVDSAQIGLLMAQAAHSSTGRRDRALLALLWETGAWASELARLNLGDFDSTSQTLFVGRGGSHERTLALPPAAATALTDYLAHGLPAPDSCQPDDPLLRNQRGGRLTRQGIWLIVRRIAQAAGMQNPITPRHLRRAAAIRLCDDQTSGLWLDGTAPVTHAPHPLDND